MMEHWSNLALVTTMRTYSRNNEKWKDIVRRVIKGNIRNHNVSEKEIKQLEYLMLNRKATPAGRGLWWSGTDLHDKLGGVACCNCWFVTGDNWEHLVLAQDCLMLGGGVGMSVEHRYVSKLPKVKDATIQHRASKDTFYIVPDTREGWCELIRLVLESFFVTGKSFSYSTICIRGKGEPINGFGGTASGPIPLINSVDKIQRILKQRIGKHIRPIDMMDLLCCIGEMVVAGNVRRSAIIILGDPWDREYLTSKRWDLKQVPVERQFANLSVVCSNAEDLHPSFWRTYESGEPFGIVNRETIQKYGRIGDVKPDTAVGVNPCGEATLEHGEPCNLQELFLPNIKDKKEFTQAARLMHRYGKRVCLEQYHHQTITDVVHRNMRIGTGITGCLQSDLFNEQTLDEVYNEIQEENYSYSKELNVPESIRTTLIKPSGTLSLIGECTPGIHPAFSEYCIRRVRFSDISPLIPMLKETGHHIAPQINIDGSLDYGTLVADFPVHMPNAATAHTYDTWAQLEAVKMAQRAWSDQSISVTVYYKKADIPKLKTWLHDNISEIKTLSFLCHDDHGFEQAPIEEITAEQYERMSAKLKPIQDFISEDAAMEECEKGQCPVR